MKDLIRSSLPGRPTPLPQTESQTPMPILATWIREKDEPFFARWFLERSDLEVRNVRHEDAPPNGDLVLPAGAAGLLLTGGPDIGEKFLRQPVPDPSVIEEDAQPERDAWEFAAAREAVERGLPVFAICKGVQVLNVALGGTLHLDIPGHNAPALRLGNLQPVTYGKAAPDHTRYERINSSHHQALDRLGDGLEVEAWSPGDDIIEQVRRRGDPYCFGVQYSTTRSATSSIRRFFMNSSTG